jgi:hypothetical protein
MFVASQTGVISLVREFRGILVDELETDGVRWPVSEKWYS